MKFDILNKEETEELNIVWSASGKPLKPGECTFEVKKAESKTSKSGNEMIKLDLVVKDGEGGSDYVFDYLVAGEHRMCKWKIARFCESTKLLEELEKGELPSYECIGTTGSCVVANEQDNSYINAEGFSVDPDPKNVIKEYLKPGEKANIKPQTISVNAKAVKPKAVDAKAGIKIDPEFNDDIPF